ncbi:hypothetical protein DE146DRAFT_497806 [Phaeosphaeria sp. MPI-PUGE-AT-0046c]|nr:hypothetical protein DE146DRAFT_497806 [Phaeosphaeria sp. MPI-PUGE-AT-0046c]
MLCDLCASIFEGDRELDVSYDWHTCAEDMQTSANQGCHLCNDARRVFNSRRETGSDPDIHEAVRYDCLTYQLQACDCFYNRLNLLLFFGGIQPEQPLIIRLYDRLGDADAEDSCFDKDGSSHFLDLTSTNLALAWLTNCFENHDDCRVENPDGWTPTRLVDVSHDPPCLREGAQISSGAAYNTLSHRWSKQPTATLSNKNLNRFKQAIPPEALSKIYLDAIEFTKRAGVQYVWIDSLCIIQDSVDDWVAQSASMDQVYQHGYCNLAAADDFNKGLNIDHCSTVNSSPGFVKTRWTNLTNACMTWYTSWSGWWSSSGQGWIEVYSRGWVVQELCLSPRTIHFQQDQLDWECRRGFACEMWPIHIPATEVGPGLCGPQIGSIAGWGQWSFSFKWPMEHNLATDQILQRWLGLVDRYTKCDLTIQTDRLVAISALAKRFALLLDDQYLAGMWKRHLVGQLDWIAVDRYNKLLWPQVSVCGYIAPSWSWASHSSIIYSPRRYGADVTVKHTHDLVNIVEASVTPKYAGATYGAVREGHLLLWGLLQPLRRVFQAMTLFARDEIEWRPAATTAGVSVEEFEKEYKRLLGVDETTDDVSLFRSKVNYSTPKRPSTDALLCLPTIMYKLTENSYPSVRAGIVGILLQQDCDEKDAYKRIGRFELSVTCPYSGNLPTGMWELERDFLSSVILGQKISEPTGDEGIVLDGMSKIRII